MSEQIYDAEKHIQIEAIENIIETNKGKKIYVFGGGTAAEILMNRLLYRYEVAGFLDNNRNLWGKHILNKEIINPELLMEEEKGTYIVLILSKHVHDISIQLEEMGLAGNRDYYDIYNRFSEYFRIKKFEGMAERFIEFINRIPDGTFDKVPAKNNKEIGVICIGEMTQADSWYPMLQALLLCYNGYNTTLIIDSLKSYDDIIYFNGIHEIAKKYIDYVLKILTKKCPVMHIEYIDENQREELEADDIKMANCYGIEAVKWFDSQKDEVFLQGNSDRIAISQKILKENLKVIKAFFTGHQYDTINVFTGIHRHRCLYVHAGEKKNIRVSSYDGDESGVTLYAADGASGHCKDTARLVKGDWFSDKEKHKIIRMAKENFALRRKATSDSGMYSYQLVGEQPGIERFYDVVIPLNISWDSAALARDDVFESNVQWLQETVDYIMENTDATVMVREHPAQNCSKEYNYERLEQLLKADQYGNRVYMCKAEEKINTYQYIDNAKLVLPYTSTTGLEAVIMDKPIIMHTKCYYSDMSFSYKAGTKTDYFEKIKEVLENGRVLTEQEKEEAYMAYFCQINYPINTDVTECNVRWAERSLRELADDTEVKKIIRIIAEGLPAAYINLKEKLG